MNQLPRKDTPLMKWPRRTRDPIPGHTSAWVGFWVGIAASIAANVLHAMESTWTYPELVGAAFWPTALLISVEILTRVAWPRGWQWVVTRGAGVLIVALVAAALSYLHMRSLLISWGEGAFQATIGPAAVDGLMLISATALLAISRSAAVPAAVLAAPMLEGVDAANVDLAAKIRAAVAEAMPAAPAVPAPGAAPAVTRIALGNRRTRRSSRLAGSRRRAVLAPLEAAPAHPAPPPPPQQPPAEVAALNGSQRPGTTSAPLNGTTKTTGTRKTRRTTTKRTGGALDQASYEKAFQFWQAETARGNPPSAQRLGEHIGRSKATGGRLLQEFREKVPA